VGAKYKIGDLVTLNDFGRLVLDDNNNRLVLIISTPVNKRYPLDHIPEEEYFYFWSYDIMVGDELITDVPQEFLESIDGKK
jgi:hypothetical protein